MDVPVNEYIPHDCTMKAVTTKAATAHIVDISVRFPIIA
jgi:hypothetical protein